MKRRSFATGVGGAVMGSLAGCAGSVPMPNASGSSGQTTGSTSADGSNAHPIGDANPWNGTILNLAGDVSAEAVRSTLNDVPRILLARNLTTAFVDTTHTGDTGKTAKAAGFDVHSVTAASWDGGPVCDVGNRLQFLGKPSQKAVEAAFSDAVMTIRARHLSGERTWIVYTPPTELKTLSARLRDLGVASNASITTYGSCNTGAKTTSADSK